MNKKKITLDHLEKCKTYFSVWIILEKCYCVFKVQCEYIGDGLILLGGEFFKGLKHHKVVSTCLHNAKH